ncbi:MAG TPA: HNH endonuclease [Euzebya sp.]|nr:HNH endonuclease [Euzebya sp.]
MNADLLRRAAGLRVHSRNGTRAPHKPLLLLLAIRRVQQDEQGAAAWDWWSRELGPLLVEYAPNTARPRPEYPFRRLVEDGLWVIEDLDALPDEAFVSGNATVRDLRSAWLADHNPTAGLPRDYESELLGSQEITEALIRLLLHRHFPPTLWQDVLDDTGVQHDLSRIISIPDEVLSFLPDDRRMRSASFAAEVMAEDGGRCVLCGFDGREQSPIRARPVGLDAAHVRWWNAEGSDTAGNGLAMCALHHRLFDRGMFGFDPTDRRVRTSPRFTSTTGWASMDHAVVVPERIARENLVWQITNVFKAA